MDSRTPLVYLCPCCHLGIPLHSSCVLCGHPLYNTMPTVDLNHYPVHLCCALYTSGVQLYIDKSREQDEPVHKNLFMHSLVDLSNIPEDHWNAQKCVLCGMKKGVPQKCMDTQCNTVYSIANP